MTRLRRLTPTICAFHLGFSLVQKPWIHDGVGIREMTLLDRILTVARADSIAASQIAQMPFLNTFGTEDMIVVERLEELARYSPQRIQEMLSDPALSSGITDNQSGIVALTYLRFQDPDAAVTIESLAWVKDGLIAAENQPVRLMVALALESPRIFRALAGRAWVQDGLSPNEADVMDNIIGISGNSMATRDEAVGLSIVDMPFLVLQLHL